MIMVVKSWPLLKSEAEDVACCLLLVVGVEMSVHLGLLRSFLCGEQPTIQPHAKGTRKRILRLVAANRKKGFYFSSARK
jgi:hypothetical protein